VGDKVAPNEKEFKSYTQMRVTIHLIFVNDGRTKYPFYLIHLGRPQNGLKCGPNQHPWHKSIGIFFSIARFIHFKPRNRHTGPDSLEMTVNDCETNWTPFLVLNF
jgi:hypothetical protein